MYIHRLKSLHPISPYAPYWNVPIGLAEWSEKFKVDVIRNFLIDKEKDILKLDVQNDGGTGLPDSSITTRYGKYNLFDYIDECAELDELLKFLQISYIKFIDLDNTELFPLEIVCWYNIIYQGQSFNWHEHSMSESAYLSGNMHLDDYPSSGTTYKNYDMEITMPNIKGGLTIFPSCIAHKVGNYEDTTPRVSLAFDLHICRPPYYGTGGNGNPVVFMNQNIYENLTKD